MPYTNNNGVKIYYEVEGEGPPLVWAHGLSGSINQFRRGKYYPILREDYQLVMFDARGHGRSDKPHDPGAYGKKMRDDVIAVMDDARITKAHYFGYSMGSRIGFWVAKDYPERFFSLILGGNNPYSKDEALSQFMRETMQLLIADHEGFIRRMEQMIKRPLTLEERNEYLAADGKAYIAAYDGNDTALILTNEELSNISVPCFVFCGELDPRYAGAKECAGYIPKAKFMPITGFGHEVIEKVDLILPHVKEFLAQVSKK
jgi:pimeloyl-ACP methyl ester carboxylesterase